MRVVPLMPPRTVNNRRLLPSVRRKPVSVTPLIVPCKPRSPPRRRSKARLMRLRVNVTPRQAPNRRLILSRPFRVLSVRRRTPHGRLRNPLRLRLVVRVLPVGMLKLLHRVLRMLRRPLPPRRPRRRAPHPRLPPRRLPRPMQPIRPQRLNRPWTVSVSRWGRSRRVSPAPMRRWTSPRLGRSTRRTSPFPVVTRENRHRSNMTPR